MKKITALLLILSLLLCGCSVEVVTGASAQSTGPLSSAAQTEPIAEPTQAPPAETLFPAETDTLKVHFIDVGQADCALLECGGEFALIDAGYPETGPDVVEYLNAQGVEELSLLVGTHPHGDHIGGMPYVFDAIPVENVWTSAITYTNDYVTNFLSGAAAQGLPVQQPQVGDTFQLGGATITMIGPLRTNYDDTNNLSLVLMVQFGDIRFLFTGDMERDAEVELVESGTDVKADVLKVGHHGSYTSTSYLFLRQVAPTYAVISCGAANDYGHPHDEPLSRLRDADVTIYRTDKMYTIVAESDGTEVRFRWGNRFAEPWTPAA